MTSEEKKIKKLKFDDFEYNFEELPEKAKNLLNGLQTVDVQLKMYGDTINLLNVSDGAWAGTKICQKKFLKSPQWLRNLKIKKKPIWRIFNKKIQIIENGGWHFSFLKKPEDIKKKIISYSHQEFNSENFTSIDNIKEKILKGVDLFERNIKYQRVNIDESFPEYINNNKQKFKDWII